MRKLVERILKKYGTDILLRRVTGDVILRGFLQHTGSLAWQNMRSIYSPLGRVPGGQYRLILPPQPEIAEGEMLRLGERWYTVRRCEKVWYRNEWIYSWCLCDERGEPDNWGFQ